MIGDPYGEAGRHVRLINLSLHKGKGKKTLEKTYSIQTDFTYKTKIEIR
jgi:hypothetical protein